MKCQIQVPGKIRKIHQFVAAEFASSMVSVKKNNMSRKDHSHDDSLHKTTGKGPGSIA